MGIIHVYKNEKNIRFYVPLNFSVCDYVMHAFLARDI